MNRNRATGYAYQGGCRRWDAGHAPLTVPVRPGCFYQRWSPGQTEGGGRDGVRERRFRTAEASGLISAASM